MASEEQRIEVLRLAMELHQSGKAGQIIDLAEKIAKQVKDGIPIRSPQRKSGVAEKMADGSYDWDTETVIEWVVDAMNNLNNLLAKAHDRGVVIDAVLFFKKSAHDPAEVKHVTLSRVLVDNTKFYLPAGGFPRKEE